MVYYFIAASRSFLCEQEPLSESLRERRRNYSDRGKEIDFWLVEQPNFLDLPAFAKLKSVIPQPAAAVISTDPKVIRWLKLRLEFAATGEFDSADLADPLGSSAVGLG
ncbi:MAG: DUF2488 family protein [Pseudanabaenaceae cyanobacterium bins.68]|nr:DUF2488 family protein [Pseudanabaenaceae cyanobacterium bins.68]